MALASIQKIRKLVPHPNADALDIATVLDWQCVVKKGEFKEGDPCVYVEIDSVALDGPEWSEFLRDRKFRIRTIKLRGELSQGLALPVSILPQGKSFYLEDDVSEILGVKKYSKEDAAAKGNPLRSKTRRQKPFPTYLVPKTDEPRIQSVGYMVEMLRDKSFVATVKLDGSSATYLKHDGKFMICSRNLILDAFPSKNWWWRTKRWLVEKTPFIPRRRREKMLFNLEGDTDTAYHKIALKYDLANVVPEGYAIQGELCGPAIQKNRLGLKEHDFFVFNIWDIKERRYLNWWDVRSFCVSAMLKPVPLDFTNIDVDEPLSVEFFLRKAEGYYGGTKTHREGIVVRPLLETRTERGVRLSFKAVSNSYLLKEED